MKAIIFDMDGVIIDSEKYWQQDEFFLIKRLIPAWAEEDQHKIIGLHLDDIYIRLVNDYGLNVSYDDFFEKVNNIAIQIYKDYAQLMPGFFKVIQLLQNAAIPMGIASSSRRNWMDIVLERFKIDQYFDVTVSAQEINGPGKPAPDIYLYTAKKLGVQPNECVVIEDSENGIRSAKAADMYCIGFRNGINDHVNMQIADEVMQGFENFKLLN